MSPSIYACITTRDGNIRNDVTSALITASSRAKAAGVSIGAGRQMYPYGIATCRNKAVAAFLKHTAFSHLLFIDDDVLLPPDSITCMAELAARPECAVIGAGYPSLRMTAPGIHYLYVTLLPLGAERNDEWAATFPPGVAEINACGAGCLLIRRDVFEAVDFPWFRWPEKYVPETGEVEVISDDVDFCAAARAKGFRIWTDGRIRCGHLKTVNLLGLLDGTLSVPDGAVLDDYASHIPALCAVSAAVPIRTVVEYGSGRYSTPLFLDRNRFRDLGKLISFESNREWFRDATVHNRDERLDLCFCPIDQMPDADAPEADLVFIDCDAHAVGANLDYSARKRLIERYSADPRAVVAVHDANFPQIAPAVEAANFRYKALFIPPSGPHTALLSNAVDVSALLGTAGCINGGGSDELR